MERRNLAYWGYSQIQVASVEHPFTATIRVRPEAIAKTGINEQEFRASLQRLDDDCQQFTHERASQHTPPTRKRPTANFQHPAERPDVYDMLADLSNKEAHRFGLVFGRFRLSTAWGVAAGAEAEIYNSWVLLQCLKKGLREPGALSAKAYVERYWVGGNEEDDDAA